MPEESGGVRMCGNTEPHGVHDWVDRSTSDVRMFRCAGAPLTGIAIKGLMLDADGIRYYAGPWEVRSPDPAKSAEDAFFVERATERGTERGAICWDYGVACVIEAALNLRDGTVE